MLRIERERQRQRVRRDFADAVVGRIGDPDAVPRAGVGVDGVEARADPAHDAERRQRGDDALGDRRVLEQDAARSPARRRSRRPRSCTARRDELDAGGARRARARASRSGKSLSAKRTSAWAVGGRAARRTWARANGQVAGPVAASVKRRRPHSPRLGRRHAAIIARPMPPCPAMDAAMTKLLQTTIAGSLPKPAWLAEPNDALGAVAPRRRRARRGQARRRAPRASRPGATPASTSSPTASRRAAIS